MCEASSKIGTSSRQLFPHAEVDQKLLQPGQRRENLHTATRSHMGERLVHSEGRHLPGPPVCSEEPVHSFRLFGWETWLMTWQRSPMQIANICHSAGSSPYIYLLILLNISAYYWLFVGGGQWCMFLHDAVQKKAISCNPCIHSCCFF